jgi:hypothetical protein
MESLEVFDDQYRQYAEYQQRFPGASPGESEICQSSGRAEDYRPGIDLDEKSAERYESDESQQQLMLGQCQQHAEGNGYRFAAMPL